MASLPSQHPTLSLHLADDALTPLITSSRSRAHLESLTSLATSALTSQMAAQRVGMGAVERIMVEYPAPAAAAVVLQSYLHVPTPPRPATANSTDDAAGERRQTSTTTTAPSSLSSSTDATTTAGDGGSKTATTMKSATIGKQTAAEEVDDVCAPRLVSVVVARSLHEAAEAKRAAARLERVGREFQSQWAAENAD